jgi:CRP-like cAMP-binding protein
MAIVRPKRAVSSPDLSEAGDSDLPLDHALALLLADETENALRWGAAVLESGPWTPSALVVTARLLDQMGRRRAAIEGLRLAVQQATAAGNLPLAMAAIGDLRSLGADVVDPIDKIATAFCQGSDRLHDAQTQPLLPQLGEFRPLSPFLTGPALASKAAQILESVRRTENEGKDTPAPRVTPMPLFSALGKDALHDLLAAFETITVPAGHAVIREGEEEAAAYIVARGELEVSRRSADDDGKSLVLARLGSGAFFGEMALLSQLPGAASVIATRPSILLVARREALEAVVEKHPDVAVELAAHCRRQAVANLGWASPVVVAIPPEARATLVEHFETRMFEAGDRLVERGDDARGLHLIVSGAIAVVANDGGERIVLATLTAGETVGEVELVLCRNAAADAVAIRPTATLFLPRDEFFGLVQDHPTILHGLYAVAVRRHAETKLAMNAGATDETLLRDGQDEPVTIVENISSSRDEDREPPSARARITPLARGTLPMTRVSPPPARVSPPLPPPPALPSLRRTLPPPPWSPAPARVASTRPAAPPAAPEQPLAGAPLSPSRASPSIAPMMAPIASAAGAPPPRSQSMALVALAAVAAGAVAFSIAREYRGSIPAAPPAAAVAAATNGSPAAASNVPGSPASSLVATEAPPQSSALRPKTGSAPLYRAKAKAAPPPVVVTVEASAAPANPAPPTTATTQPARQTPPAEGALSVGEFGGRE